MEVNNRITRLPGGDKDCFMIANSKWVVIVIFHYSDVWGALWRYPWGSLHAPHRRSAL